MGYLATFLVPAAFVVVLQANLTPDALPRMTNEDLVTTYETVTIAARAPSPHDAGPSPLARNPAYGLVKAEILRRSRGMAPHLSKALKSEVDAKRPDTPDRISSGLVYDEIKLLTEIGDPRAVETMLEILQTPTGPRELGPAQPHYQALEAIEKLTFVSFHTVQPESKHAHYTVEHASAVEPVNFSPATFPKAVQLYREWLQGDGRDTGQWLPLAQKRARALLEGDDLDDAYCAAAFLSGPPSLSVEPKMRDDMPKRTLARIAAIVEGYKVVVDGDKVAYEYRGRPVARDMFGFIFAYGPRARPYSEMLIRLEKEVGLRRPGTLVGMNRIGGHEIMAYYFDVLAQVEKEINAARDADSKVEKRGLSADPANTLVYAQRICRSGIDRWAGRSFETDKDRHAWWAANKDKSPEQWLRDSLPITVARADAHDANSIRLFGELLPDSPFDTANSPVLAALRGRRGPPPALPAPVQDRTRWFEEHQAELVYDPNLGVFRLPTTSDR